MTGENDEADSQPTTEASAEAAPPVETMQAAPERAAPDISADPDLMEAIVASGSPPEAIVVLIEETTPAQEPSPSEE